MALEDIVKGVEKRDHLIGVDRALQTEAGRDAPETYELFADYFQKYRGYSPADAQTLVESEEMTPKRARRDIAMFRDETETQLAQMVEADYDEVIASLPEKQLLDLAVMNLPGKDKKYIAVNQALASENVDQLKGLLADKYKEDRYWAEFIAKAHKNTVMQFGAIYLEEGKKKFIEKTLSDETTVEEKGKTKKKYTINYDKVRTYIRTTIDGMSKPEEKVNAYTTLAQYLHMAKKAKK